MSIENIIIKMQEFECFLPWVGFLGLALLVAFHFLIRKNSPKKRKTRQLHIGKKKKTHGIIFGRKGKKLVYSPVDSEGHVFCVAPSGAGKTSAVLIPTLRSWTGGAFVIDISGDISKNVNIPGKLVFAPGSPDTAPYNVFASIDAIQSENERLEALEGLALLLMPNNPHAADAARFFNTEGRKILTAALIAFYGKGLDFIEICEKIISTPCNDLLLDIQETQNQAALRYINGFRGISTSQNTLGCKQAADAAVSLFATNDVIKSSIRRPLPGELAFSPESLEYRSCFVVIDDTKLELYGQLLGLCVSQVLQYIAQRPLQNKKNILLALDEFAAFGYLDGICGTLERCRKRHTRIIALVQGIPNIRRIYDEQTTTAMLANFRFKVCLGADDIDTQRIIAETVGHENIKKISRTRGKSSSTTESESREYVIEPSTLGRLGTSLLLIHPDGHMFLEKNFYFKK